MSHIRKKIGDVHHDSLGLPIQKIKRMPWRRLTTPLVSRPRATSHHLAPRAVALCVYAIPSASVLYADAAGPTRPASLRHLHKKDKEGSCRTTAIRRRREELGVTWRRRIWGPDCLREGRRQISALKKLELVASTRSNGDEQATAGPIHDELATAARLYLL
jgi:hypothetical protein